MKSFNMSPKNKKIIVPLVTIPVILLVVILFFFQQQSEINKQQAQIKNLEAQIELQNGKLEEIKEEQAQVTSDEYIEKVARDRLGMIYPDETVFVDVSGR